MNPLWVAVNPLPVKSEPPSREFYQNMRPNTNKRGDTQRVSPLLFGASRRMGLEKLNAARMSAAGEGWTESNLNFCP